MEMKLFREENKRMSISNQQTERQNNDHFKPIDRKTKG
jgi:hypothetical protein